mmetsp:Transcript_18048/g.45696  ORF Transcript_18048/g.45696 Transcript_18048/m.45696 type:complete len:488 (+) Transcript_18048:91-1554(+)
MRVTSTSTVCPHEAAALGAPASTRRWAAGLPVAIRRRPTCVRGITRPAGQRRALLANASASASETPQQGSRDAGVVANTWLPPMEAGDRESAGGGDKLMLKNLSFPQLEEWCESLGEKPSRALQLWRWMYYDKFWMRRMEDAAGSDSYSFGRAFRDKVEAVATVDAGLRLDNVHAASDGTRKLTFEVLRGPAAGGTVEAVLIPISRRQGQKERITICVSSQLGCAMNCQFCFTGRMGLGGNLAAAQIVEQVVEARRYLAEVGDPTPLTNVVFMGMGEPFHNLDAVLTAAEIMCHPMGLHLSHNKISVSTVGLVPEIDRFCRTSKVQLAVSLHATTDEVRNWIVPVNRRYPLAELMAVLKQHFPAVAGVYERRHVLIEYVMLRDVNDTEADATRLLELLQGIEAKINLIIFNPHAGTLFKASTSEQVLAFRSVLIQGGRVCTVRDSRGDDEMAACGQLGDPGQRGDGKPRPPILTPPPAFQAKLEALQ